MDLANPGFSRKSCLCGHILVSLSYCFVHDDGKLVAIGQRMLQLGSGMAYQVRSSKKRSVFWVIQECVVFLCYVRQRLFSPISDDSRRSVTCSDVTSICDFVMNELARYFLWGSGARKVYSQLCY